jgi:hypothetical protein
VGKNSFCILLILKLCKHYQMKFFLQAILGIFWV